MPNISAAPITPACLPLVRLPLQHFQENLHSPHSCQCSVTISFQITVLAVWVLNSRYTRLALLVRHDLWCLKPTPMRLIDSCNCTFGSQLKNITPRVPSDLQQVRRINRDKKVCEQLRLEQQQQQQHAEKLAKLQAAESACGKRRRSMPERMHLFAQKNLKSLIPESDTPRSDSKIAAIKSSRSRQLSQQ